jgi:hypothetical protein
LRAGGALARSHASQRAGRVEKNQKRGAETVVLLLCGYAAQNRRLIGHELVPAPNENHQYNAVAGLAQ